MLEILFFCTHKIVFDISFLISVVWIPLIYKHSLQTIAQLFHYKDIAKCSIKRILNVSLHLKSILFLPVSKLFSSAPDLLDLWPLFLANLLLHLFDWGSTSLSLLTYKQQWKTIVILQHKSIKWNKRKMKVTSVIASKSFFIQPQNSNSNQERHCSPFSICSITINNYSVTQEMGYKWKNILNHSHGH